LSVGGLIIEFMKEREEGDFIPQSRRGAGTNAMNGQKG